MNEDQIAALVGRLTLQMEVMRLQIVELTRQLEAATKPAEPIGAEQPIKNPESPHLHEPASL